MKIGLVLDDGLDKPNGVQQYVLGLGRWFTSQGHDVHYLVGETNRTDIPNTHSLSRNLRVSFSGNHMTSPLPASKRRLKKLLNDENFDILHVQLPCSPFLGGRIIKSAPKTTAIIGTFHILPFGKFVSTANKLLGYFQKASLKRLSKVFAVSQPAAEFAKQAYGLQTTVLPNVVDIKKFQDTGAPNSDKLTTIAFLGRLEKRKGGKELLQAIRVLKQQNKLRGVQVIIGGEGPEAGNIRQFIDQHDLDNVTLRGFVPEDQKAAFLNSADITVFPSLGGESFGIVLIEAMASGKSVVLAGDNPGYRSVMDTRHDQLIDPTDTDKFAQKLAYYLEDADARRRALVWQHKHVKQFDTPNIAKALLGFYQEVLQTRSGVR